MKVIWKAACLALLVAGVSGAQAQNVTYRKDIKPLFDKQCLECHGADAPYYVKY
jgi:mono/diheme cytochrome c family protein